MGSGKSTIAKTIKKQTGMTIIDTDKEIVKREGKKIPEIFAQEGEKYFRDLETKLLYELETYENIIVSCGGGVVLREENIEAMHKIGTVVLLSASPYTIYMRVKNGVNRPLLNGKMNVNDIRAMMEERKPYYTKAAQVVVCVDRKPLKVIGKEVLEKVEKRNHT